MKLPLRQTFDNSAVGIGMPRGFIECIIVFYFAENRNDLLACQPQSMGGVHRQERRGGASLRVAFKKSADKSSTKLLSRPVRSRPF